MIPVWDSVGIYAERQKGPLLGNPLENKRASLAFLREEEYVVGG